VNPEKYIWSGSKRAWYYHLKNKRGKNLTKCGNVLTAKTAHTAPHPPHALDQCQRCFPPPPY
jgi:hypothetical protein